MPTKLNNSTGIGKLKNTDQAADRLGVSSRFLRRRARLRLPPDFIKIGDRVLYSDEVLDKFIEACTIKTGSEQSNAHGARRGKVA